MASWERIEATRAPGPDGRAAVCKTAGAGSTPAGASDRLTRRPPLAVHPHRPKTSTWPAHRLLWRAIGFLTSIGAVGRRDGVLPPKAKKTKAGRLPLSANPQTNRG